MSNRHDIDTVAIVEIASVERRRLDKEKILSFSHVQAGQTIVVYGDRANPDSMIIKADAVEFQNLLNGILPSQVLSKSMKQYMVDNPWRSKPMAERLMEKAGIFKNFTEEAFDFKAKHQDQDKYWFMPDSQGNYKNIAADEIYEVSPNLNSPWAQTPN